MISLLKLAEKLEQKFAQQKAIPSLKVLKEPHDQFSSPEISEDTRDAINEAYYISSSISSLFRELGIDMNSQAGRDNITEEQAQNLLRRLKGMMFGITSVLSRLNETLGKTKL